MTDYQVNKGSVRGDEKSRPSVLKARLSPKVFLFRHGRVDQVEFDKLNHAGEKFRDALFKFFSERQVTLNTVFHDASAKRCAMTVSKLTCEQVGFGVGYPFRTLNAVLGQITSGNYAVCCRAESIESGQLYHVKNFELHTPFGGTDHAEIAHTALANSYDVVYCLERRSGAWRQTGKVHLANSQVTE